MSALAELRTALAIARRELRGGMQGLAIFLACLALGVATIAAVGIVNRAVVDSVARDARTLLGGDVAIENPMQPLGEAEIAGLVPPGAALTREVDANSTMAANGRRIAVVLKAVDGSYPLLGEVELEPAMPIGEALAGHGFVAEPALAARLGLAVGDTVRLGEATLTLRAILIQEPDRIGGFISIGPRVILGIESLDASGLIRPGSIVDYEYRLLLPEGVATADYAARTLARHGDAGWRLRTSSDVEPGLARVTDRLSTFLTLAGLTSLLVGGLGIGLAIQSYLADRIATISTLKCIGARSRQIVWAYLAQILLLAGLGVLIGLVLGQLLPPLLLRMAGTLLPVEVTLGFYPAPLALAAAAGLLTALAFAWWPLGLARETSPAGLFRSLVAPTRHRPRAGFLAALALTLLLLAAIAVAGVARPDVGAWFVGIAAATALALGVLADLLLRALRSMGERGSATMRLAVRNLQRPGSGAKSVTVALGAGLAVLTAVALLQANLHREIAASAPDRAPSTVFIDIQPDQVATFERLVAAQPGVHLRQEAPHLRARIVRLGERPVDEVEVAENVRWTINRDRGLTYRATPPANADLAAGTWWPEDYAGPPLLSLGAEYAHGYGLGVGDTIGLNILGRVIEARIANLRREIDFASGNLEFFFIMSPGMIASAPHTVVATIEASRLAEASLIAAVGDALPNVTAISIGPMIERLVEILDRIGLAVRIVAGITLLTGVLVLAGAVAAARRRQRQQTVILKVLGATRATVLRMLAAEYLLLGVAAAILGAAVGTLGAWLLTTRLLEMSWRFAPLEVGTIAAVAILLVIAVGGVATWRLLGLSAARMLRMP